MTRTQTWIVVLGLLLAGTACGDSKGTPDARWRDLGIPMDGLREVEARSNAHGFFATYDDTVTEDLLGEVVSVLEGQGFTQHKQTPFDDSTRCMKRGSELLVVQVQGLGQLAVFDGKAGDHLMFRVCFDPTVTVGDKRTIGPDELEAALDAEK